MLRSKKDVDWSLYARRDDLVYFRTRIAPNDWYPMETFERFGNLILSEIALGSLDTVRQWGRFSVDALVGANPSLLAAGDPVDTLMRFRVQRATYFDFEALEVPSLAPGHAEVVIHYYMGAKAEEAAAYQTMGFFERLVEVAGGAEVAARFTSCSWSRGARTVLTIDWG